MRNASQPAESDDGPRVQTTRGKGAVAGRKPISQRTRDPLATAVRFLARGDRSTQQVTAFLSHHGYRPQVIRATQRTLERLGYLNDEAAALRLAQGRLRRRPMGRIALLQILTTRAFPNEIANRAVRLAYDGVTEQAIAARFLRSLPKRFKDPMREARRRAALLATRGFPEDLIEPLLISGLSDQGQS
jgi:SOS response regulatory protein OraA/RecX